MNFKRAKKMHNLGIKTGADLKNQSLTFLLQAFGKAGQYYYHIARAIDHRPINNHRVSKSVGVETTFQDDIKDPQKVLHHLHQLLDKALTKLTKKGFNAQTLTIKIKYHDFVQITRSRILTRIITPQMDITPVFERLLKNTDVGQRKIRLLGVSLSTLSKHSQFQQFRQMDLFDNI